MSVRLEHGDCLEVMRRLADEGGQVDAVITDPPYHLTSIVKRFGKPGAAPAQSTGATGVYARAAKGFMGKEWDGGDIAFRPETWRHVFELMKPGAHLLAFNHSRTWHRMTVAIEDAGFEIRDTIMWLYGSGFPKSHNLSGDWEGWGSALKPAMEPIVLARKPLQGTIAQNVAKHGTGALNIDGCRVPVEPTVRRNHGGTGNPQNWRTGNGGDFASGSAAGRWPANVVHDGSPEVLAAYPTSDGGGDIHRRSLPKTKGVYGAFAGNDDRWSGYEDSGSAARFFFSAKAGADDRFGSKHPTVKPIALMRWLVRLVTPPGGVVLDPFAGSGTTGVAALAEGLDAVLIEREAEYVADIRGRLDHYRGTGPHSLTVKQRHRAPAETDLPLLSVGRGHD